MSLILAGLVFIATVVAVALIMMANMNQPAPMPSNQKSPWPVLIGGSSIAVALICSHWVHFSW